jgi:hypothetical protein
VQLSADSFTKTIERTQIPRIDCSDSSLPRGVWCSAPNMILLVLNALQAFDPNYAADGACTEDASEVMKAVALGRRRGDGFQKFPFRS